MNLFRDVSDLLRGLPTKGNILYIKVKAYEFDGEHNVISHAAGQTGILFLA
jgi:hypothetical protein